MWGRGVPRQRIYNRIIGQRELAGWVISRQLLARRLLRGPLLAQLVAPAPASERRAGRARTVFRPRLIADPASPVEGASPSDAERSPNDAGVWAVAPPIIEDAPPAPAARTPLADTYPVAHDGTERPAAPMSATAAPARPDERAAAIAPPVQRALPPRERLGRRVEERVQELPPPMAAVAPIPAAPTPERVGATTPPPVEPPLTDAPAPHQAATLDTPDAGDVVIPLPPAAPSRHLVETIEPDERPTDVPPVALPPDMAAPALPGERPGERREVIRADGGEAPPIAPAPRDAPIPSPAALSEPAMARPEQPASEARPATPVRESPAAETASVKPDVVAERPQSKVLEDVPAATVAMPSPVTTRETSAADLFGSRGTDRSPAAWLARLTGAPPPQPEQTVALTPATPPASARPTPFLAPSPRFVAPVSAHMPSAEPVETGETQADSAGPAPERTAMSSLDNPPGGRGSERETAPPEPPPIGVEAPPLPEPERGIIEQDTEATTVAASNDDGAIAPVRLVPDAAQAVRPDGVRDTELFASPGADRSPAAWIERLRRAESTPVERETAPPIAPGQPVQGASSRRAFARPTEAAPPDARGMGRAPTPLPEASRRFLQPLVGIDPGDVPVHEGARADAVAAAYRADALTDGNVVVLGAGHDAAAPETLGLIAHELTHVARRRDSRFVPPIARADERADRFKSPTGAAPEMEDTTSLADEERLARRVESRVTDAARAADAAPSPRTHPPSSPSDRSRRADAPIAPSAAGTPRGRPGG